MAEQITNYIIANRIELLGAILSLIYLYLSIKQKISLWFFGIISSVFYIVIFFETKLYADMSLQFYYVFVSIYGWLNWGKEKAKLSKTEVKLTTRMAVMLTFATGAIYLIYLYILKQWTDSPIPATDAIVGALSITGTWMLARKYIENWLVWIVADAICVGIYFFKGLYPTAILFIIYTIMAAIGYQEWKKAALNSSQNDQR